jgi:hypothetical protein
MRAALRMGPIIMPTAQQVRRVLMVGTMRFDSTTSEG